MGFDLFKNVMKIGAQAIGGIAKASPIGGLIDVGSTIICGKPIDKVIGDWVGGDKPNGVPLSKVSSAAAALHVDTTARLTSAKAKLEAERSAAAQAVSREMTATSSGLLVDPANGYEAALVTCLSYDLSSGFAPWSCDDNGMYQLGEVITGYQKGSSSRFPTVVSSTISVPIATFLGQKGSSDISARITAISKFAQLSGSVQNPLEVLDFFLYRDPDLVLSPWDSATGYIAAITAPLRDSPSYKAMVKVLRVCQNRADMLAPFRSLTAPWVSSEDEVTRQIIGAHPIFADMSTMAIFGVVGMELIGVLNTKWFKPNALTLRTFPELALGEVAGAAPAAPFSGDGFTYASVEYAVLSELIAGGATIYQIEDALALRRIYNYQQWLSLRAITGPTAPVKRRMAALQYTLLCLTQMELIASIVESALDSGLSTQDWRDIYSLLSNSEDSGIQHVIAVSNETTAPIAYLGNEEIAGYITARCVEETSIPVFAETNFKVGSDILSDAKSLQVTWAQSPRPVSLSGARIRLSLIQQQYSETENSLTDEISSELMSAIDKLDSAINGF